MKARLKIWWVTHRHQLWPAIGMAIVFLLYALVSYFDYQDAVATERVRTEWYFEKYRECAGHRAMEGTPRTVFIIEARTPKEAALKLAVIAGDADLQRTQLKHTK